jgi:mRNA interferase RelE/StbE
VSYEVRITPAAEKDLDKLPESVYLRLAAKFSSLEENSRSTGVKKLSSREEYCLRVGDYRVLFTIDDSKGIVTIMAAGHRRDVYR